MTARCVASPLPSSPLRSRSSVNGWLLSPRSSAAADAGHITVVVQRRGAAVNDPERLATRCRCRRWRHRGRHRRRRGHAVDQRGESRCSRKRLGSEGGRGSLVRPLPVPYNFPCVSAAIPDAQHTTTEDCPLQSPGSAATPDHDHAAGCPGDPAANDVGRPTLLERRQERHLGRNKAGGASECRRCTLPKLVAGRARQQ